MKRSLEIAEEISILMPVIMRRVIFRFFQKTEIPQTQLFALMTLFHYQGSATVTTLSREMDITPPTMTRMVDRLEKSQYVKRVYNQKDRRSVQIVFTPKGKNLVLKLRKVIISKWNDVLSKLSKTDRENYLTILRKIKGILL